MKKTTRILFLIAILAVFSSFAKVTKITSMQQFKDLKNNNQYLLLKFHAPWCPACVAMAPFFKEIANQADLDHIIFADINTDDNPDISKAYSIRGIPAFIYVKDKEIAHKEIGGRPDFKDYTIGKLNEVFPRP